MFSNDKFCMVRQGSDIATVSLRLCYRHRAQWTKA
jgi:hypothetical protein